MLIERKYQSCILIFPNGVHAGSDEISVYPKDKDGEGGLIDINFKINDLKSLEEWEIYNQAVHKAFEILEKEAKS